MAISINQGTRLITIPQADLTFISGSLYTLDTNQFRNDVMAILDDDTHIWLPDAFSHNTEVAVAGVTYARIIEFINSFSIQFEDTGSAYTVRLEGSNNNIFDVENGILIPTDKVTVISTNSAGLQTVLSGSGLDAGQDAKLTSVEAKAAEIWKLMGLEQGVTITITPSGIDSDDGDIDIDFTGDGITSTEMERQP